MDIKERRNEEGGMNVECTEIILRNENGEYAVKVYETGLDMNQLVNDVIVPVLLAAGYSQTTIDEYLCGE